MVACTGITGIFDGRETNQGLILEGAHGLCSNTGNGNSAPGFPFTVGMWFFVYDTTAT